MDREQIERDCRIVYNKFLKGKYIKKDKILEALKQAYIIGASSKCTV